MMMTTTTTTTSALLFLLASPALAIHPYVMAHRGCCASGIGGYAPENTLAAFTYAHNIGAHMFETDLRFTADGEIVIMHDSTLDRTTNCSGAVSNWTMADILTECDAGSWLGSEFIGEKVPTVHDLMAFLASSSMVVVLDLKERGLTGPIVAAAEANGGVDASQLIASINYRDDAPDVVAHLSRSTVIFNPNIEGVAPPANMSGAEYFGDLRAMGAGVLFPYYGMDPPKTLTLGMLSDVAARYGAQVWTWTVDLPQLWDDVIAAGARVICTNDPSGALSYFRHRQECITEQCSAAVPTATPSFEKTYLNKLSVDLRPEGNPEQFGQNSSSILMRLATGLSLQSRGLLVVTVGVIVSLAFITIFISRSASNQ